MHEQLAPISKRAWVCTVSGSWMGKCAKDGYTLMFEMVYVVLTI